MSKWNDGFVGIGDPVEVELFEVLNLRGDYRCSWVPATVSGIRPVEVTFADSSRLVLGDVHPFRKPVPARTLANL